MYAFAGGLLVLIYLAAAVIGLGIIGIIVAVIATSIYGLIEDREVRK